MKQSPLLKFESAAFADARGEDERTNPGTSGRALAEWLAQKLRAQGFPSTEVIPEDFGWCVSLESKPHKLYVACASAEELPNHWRVFVFAEGALMARVFGKDKSSESVAAAYAAVKQALQGSAQVHGLREESA